MLAKSPVITTSFVKVIEKEFQRQDALVPTMSTFIEHIEDLIHVQFREVTENTPKDASVEIQRAGFSRIPIKLELAKVIKEKKEPPIQLLWILKMSDLLKEAISNWYWSPFKPAPILENFKMEFNILRVDAFYELLNGLRTTEIVKLKSDFCFYRSRLMRGMLALFNHQARSRYDYQGHLAIRFSRPLMKRAHKDQLLNEGKWFKPDWLITNAKEI